MHGRIAHDALLHMLRSGLELWLDQSDQVGGLAQQPMKHGNTSFNEMKLTSIVAKSGTGASAVGSSVRISVASSETTRLSSRSRP